MLSALRSHFIEKGLKKTENFEHIVVLLLFLFTLNKLKVVMTSCLDFASKFPLSVKHGWTGDATTKCQQTCLVQLAVTRIVSPPGDMQVYSS